MKDLECISLLKQNQMLSNEVQKLKNNLFDSRRKMQESL
jgi:hypothetical protein